MQKPKLGPQATQPAPLAFRCAAHLQWRRPKPPMRAPRYSSLAYLYSSRCLFHRLCMSASVSYRASSKPAPRTQRMFASLTCAFSRASAVEPADQPLAAAVRLQRGLHRALLAWLGVVVSLVFGAEPIDVLGWYFGFTLLDRATPLVLVGSVPRLASVDDLEVVQGVLRRAAA